MKLETLFLLINLLSTLLAGCFLGLVVKMIETSSMVELSSRMLLQALFGLSAKSL